MTLTSQDCDSWCKEEGEFSMKFIVTALSLFDQEENEFEEVLLVITFDGNVIKIENIKEDEDGKMKFVGRELILQLSPENLSEKLLTCPIMFDLSRGCEELGMQKLDVSECFANAVKCEQFSSETRMMDLKFTKDGEETATMTLVFQLSRNGESQASHNSSNLYKGYASQKKRQSSLKKISLPSDENSSEIFEDDSDLSFTCDTDLAPVYEESEERGVSSFPESSKSTRSKCCSDIATSLNAQDYSDDLKTFCNECSGYSISGVTCENKEMFPSLERSINCYNSIREPEHDAPFKSVSQVTLISKSNCQMEKARICPECFVDLSVIGKDTPCPKCASNAQLNRRLVSFKSEPRKIRENENIRDCIKSVFEEIFLETKDRLVSDWKRLNKTSKNNRKVNKIRNSRNSLELAEKSGRRCLKAKKTKAFRNKNSDGFHKKSPKVMLGHNLCQSNGNLVPKNMGWLWNAKIEGISEVRSGWKPGSVRKSVAKIMKVFLNESVLSLMPIAEQQPPTLRLKKKNGEFTIIMNPLIDESKLCENPSPIVFKIQKTEDDRKRSIIRTLLKSRGLNKTCNCGTFEECKCLSFCDKTRLKLEMEKLSKEFCLQSQLSVCDLRDTSESEIDVEFTPPSAAKLKNACIRAKAVKTSVAGTQYEAVDSAFDAKNDDSKDDAHQNQLNDDARNVKTKKIASKGRTKSISKAVIIKSGSSPNSSRRQ